MPILMVGVTVLGFLLGAILLLILFSLLFMAQKGDAVLEKLERDLEAQRGSEPAWMGTGTDAQAIRSRPETRPEGQELNSVSSVTALN